MEMIPVIVLVVLGVPIALAVWLIVRAVQARGRIEELSFRLSELETEVIRLKRERNPQNRLNRRQNRCPHRNRNRRRFSRCQPGNKSSRNNGKARRRSKPRHLNRRRLPFSHPRKPGGQLRHRWSRRRFLPSQLNRNRNWRRPHHAQPLRPSIGNSSWA